MEFTTRFELHSQTTRLFESASQMCRQSVSKTGFSPSTTLYSKRLVHGPTTERRFSRLQLGQAKDRLPDFKFELFPLHSPLLRESLLVSFPPLIDMLKFSG